MASNQDHVQVKHNEQAGQVSDTAKVNTSKAAQNGEQILDAARDGLNKVFDLREQTAEKAKQIVQRSVESVSRQAHEATDRFTRTLVFRVTTASSSPVGPIRTSKPSRAAARF